MKNSIQYFFSILFFFLTITSAQNKFEHRTLIPDTDRNGFPCWSPDGKNIVYQVTNHNDSLGRNGLWIISKDGIGAKQILRGIAEHPKWSPDNKYIAFDADTGNSIKLILIEVGTVLSFLPDSIQIKNGGLPCWSPDGSQIAFLERKYSSLCIYNFQTNRVQSIFSKEGLLPIPGCFTPDGKYVLVSLMNMQTRKSSIQKINVNDESAKQIIIDNENFYRHLTISPDGSLIIFAALNEKYLGLYLTLSDGGRSIPLVVTPGSHNEAPSWSLDGKSIIYAGGGIYIMDAGLDQLKKELIELNK